MFRRLIKNSSHPFWVIFQQLLSRGSLAIKFFILAKLLGPDLFGTLTFLLMGLTIIEALTELGLLQAVVQYEEEINEKQLNAVWTLQLVRGLIIALLFYITYYCINIFSNYNYSQNVIITMSLIPLIKNSMSPGIFMANRFRNFRAISIIFSISFIVDLILTTILLIKSQNLIVAVLPLFISECIKNVLSYIFFPLKPIISFRFSIINNLRKYGNWILKGSILTVLNNQLDKILAATFLGPLTLGVYQMSFKLAQLTISDITVAISQYLFPTLSEKYRINRQESFVLFELSFQAIALFSLAMLSVVWANVDVLIELVLGEKWLDAVRPTQFLMINMFFGALMSVSVPFVRAIGRPDYATKATFIQLIVFAVICIFLLHYFKLMGLIISIIESIVLATVYLVININKKIPSFASKSIKYLLKSSLVLFLIPLKLININKFIILGLSISLLIFVFYYIYVKLLKRIKNLMRLGYEEHV